MMLVLGGTSDALEIAGELYQRKKEVVVSTATEYGYSVSKGKFPGRVVSGKMTGEDLKNFLNKYRISCVIDASHPFAENISQNAVSVCQELGIKYLRFERPQVNQKNSGVIYCAGFPEAGELAEKIPGIIFITIGKNHIETVLAKISDKKRVRVRVLPQSETIAQLEGLGLNADQIIAMKGPFSEEMNLLMLKETGAASLICKDSRKQGGTEAKLEAALKLGIKTIMIRRPKIDYPNKYQDMAELINYVSQKNY